MSNPITKRLRASVAIVQTAGNEKLLEYLKCSDEKSINKMVNDASCSKEAEYLTKELGQTGKLDKGKVILGAKLPRDWGKSSNSWVVACHVDRVAQALEAVGYLSTEDSEVEEVQTQQ